MFATAADSILLLLRIELDGSRVLNITDVGLASN
jgi:hypothetical protein